MGNTVVKSIKESKITESIETGVEAVKAKITDPQLQKEVTEKAVAGWTWLSGAAMSILTAAYDTAYSIASEFTASSQTEQEPTKPSDPTDPNPDVTQE